MGHRHPSRLDAEGVEHSGARRLLRAELANCPDCRDKDTAKAVAESDLVADGMIDSLLRGYAIIVASRPGNRSGTRTATLYDLAAADEQSWWSLSMREVMRLVQVRVTRRSRHVETEHALAALRDCAADARRLMLDDLVDCLIEEEPVTQQRTEERP